DGIRGDLVTGVQTCALPIFEADNHLIPAGVLTFGVEYRNVDPESLRATYAGNASQLAELEERSPEGGFFDSGVSIHVSGTEDGRSEERRVGKGGESWGPESW